MTVAKGEGDVETDARCEMNSYQAEDQREYWHIGEQRSDPETCLTLVDTMYADRYESSVWDRWSEVRGDMMNKKSNSTDDMAYLPLCQEREARFKRAFELLCDLPFTDTHSYPFPQQYAALHPIRSTHLSPSFIHATLSR
jgi:hypothetical protein